MRTIKYTWWSVQCVQCCRPGNEAKLQRGKRLATYLTICKLTDYFRWNRPAEQCDVSFSAADIGCILFFCSRLSLLSHWTFTIPSVLLSILLLHHHRSLHTCAGRSLYCTLNVFKQHDGDSTCPNNTKTSTSLFAFLCSQCYNFIYYIQLYSVMLCCLFLFFFVCPFMIVRFCSFAFRMLCL